MRNKSLKNQLKAQFYRGNRLTFGFSVFAALSVGSMALIVSWLMQQLIDAGKAGAPNAMPLGRARVAHRGIYDTVRGA